MFRRPNAAYGVAILVFKDLLRITVIERSRIGSGFDFWCGYQKEDYPFQNRTRLEVSGIRNGTKSEIMSRVKQRLKRKWLPRKELPSYVAVVEFGRPVCQAVKK